MALIIRNSNKYIYTVKSKLKGYLYRNPLLLKNYLKVKEAFIKAGGFAKVPDNGLFKKIFIETVSYCNNDCAFCPASAKTGLKRPEHIMSEALYMKILQELTEISFQGSIAFHCNNEPLLDRHLPSRIKTARGLLKTNFFYLYTNGTIINIESANQLFAAGLNRIIISNYSDNYELIPPVKNLIDNSSGLQGEVIVNYRLKDEYLGNRAGESPNGGPSLKKPLKVICARPLTELVVGYEGTVPLCCADGLWKSVMGNARESSLKDIWFSGSFKRIRRSLAEGARDCTEICRVCDALKLPRLKGSR